MKGTKAAILILAIFGLSFCQDPQTETTERVYVCRDGCTCTRTGGCNGCIEGYKFTEIVQPQPPVTTRVLQEDPNRLCEDVPEKYGMCTMYETKSLLWLVLLGMALGPILIVLVWAIFCPKGLHDFQCSQNGCEPHPNPEAQRINA